MLFSNRLKSWGIVIGLVVGALIGGLFYDLVGDQLGKDPNEMTTTAVLLTWIVANVFDPLGTIFIRSLFMIVIPLVFSSLALGVSNLGNTNTLKTMGLRVLSFYIVTTIFAILVGQILIFVIQPGVGLDQEVMSEAIVRMESRVDSLAEKSSWVGKSLWPGLVQTIIPKNILREFSNTNMLAVIFVSMLFGIGIMFLKNERTTSTLREVLTGITDITIMIVGWVMRLAPYAVAALMASAVFNFGWNILGKVMMYVFVVVLGYLIHFFIVYGTLLKTIVKIPLKEFYKRASNIFLTAFSTSSSSGTMPVTMQTLQDNFGVPKHIVSFTIPIGVTFNMDGTALFEVVAAIFVAQVFGVEITPIGQITLIVLVLITSIGVAGVPGGSLPILMAAMAALGIPPQGIALILGVDRFLDMGRTVLNVTGDTVAALFLARRSGVDLDQNIKNIPIS